ncbi:MAG: hypothetical protein LBV46_00570, partial [Bacteroidales bacterium]|nr:hypothetical protein [Bacteroidales bacterium]
MRRKTTKKIGKIVLRVIIALIVLDLLLVGLVFLPPVQNFIVGKVTQVMTDKWKSEFSIGHIYITPLMNVVGTDVTFKDHHNQKMIYVPYVKTHINGISFKPFRLNFGKTFVENADVIVRKYKNERKVNMAMWADRIKAAKTKKTTTIFRIHFDKIDMQKSRFLFQNDNEKLADNHGIIDYAYFELKDIKFLADNFNLENTISTFQLTALINSLALNQYTGFEIKDMSGNFSINAFGLTLDKAHLVTNNSNAFMDFAFHYNNWSSYSSFVDSVLFDSQINHGRVDMKDIAYFAPKIKGMDNMVTILGGKVSGTVNALKVADVDAEIGDLSFLKGNFEIEDIVSNKEPAYHLDLKESSFQISDLQAFKLPQGKQLTQLSKINGLKEAQVKGYFHGTFRSFDTHFDIASNMGTIAASMKAAQQNKKINFSGNISTNNLNIGTILEKPKLFNQLALQSTITGSMPDEESLNFKKAFAQIEAQVAHVDFAGYRYQNIDIESTIESGKVEAQVISQDDNCRFDVNGTVQFSEEKPDIMAHLLINNIQATSLFAKYNLPEKPTDGLEQVVSFLRSRPDMALTAQEIDVHISGTQIDNVNGYISINGLNLSQGNLKIDGEWLRLTLINTQGGVHKFILASNLVNASLSTNYEISGIKDTLINLAYHYLPRFLPPRHPATPSNQLTKTKINNNKYLQNLKSGYLSFEMETFQTRQIVAMFLPSVSIAPRSTLSFNTDDNRNITLHSKIPRLTIKDKFSIYGLTIESNDPKKNLFGLSLHLDTAVVHVGDTKLPFKDLRLTGTVGNDHVEYDLNWLNPPAISTYPSHLAGTFDAVDSQTVVAKVTSSSIFLKEKEWTFNTKHQVTFEKENIDFDNVVMASGESKLAVHGNFSQSIDNNMFIDVNNIDMSILNSFMTSMKIKFAGDGSANFIYGMQANRQRLLTGRAYVSDFVFNDSKFGNFFAVAAANAKGILTFSGGLFKKDAPVNSAIIGDYGVADFQNEPNRIADLRGYYLPENKTLTVHGDIDTLDIGFLKPFFTSFSHHISGVASGDISFIAKPDSTYFDGTVIVQDGHLGIKVLNTIYHLKNQIIEFDQQGIIFNNIEVTDRDDNVAKLNGYVQHHNFKDFKMKFAIETDRILALNTPKSSDTYFYGDGYVAG